MRFSSKNVAFCLPKSDKNQGKISQIIGPVVDVIFEGNQNNLPKIYDALEVMKENGEKLILECEQHIGENSIRTIAMDSADSISLICLSVIFLVQGIRFHS